MANRSRVLVTGGPASSAAVVRALLAEGHEVTVADLRAFPDPDASDRWSGTCATPTGRPGP